MSRSGRHVRCFRAEASALVALALVGLFRLPGNVAAQVSAPTPNQADKEEVPHAFLTHMGIPEGVGVFSLRLSGLTTRAAGKWEGDFGFHFETGLTKTIGLHIRNDQFLDRPRSELMFQFTALISENGMSGFAPIIEFEIPTQSGTDGRIESLIGFTSTLANSHVSLNQVLHYDPREDAIDWSASLVAVATARLFPVMEVLGEAVRGERLLMNLLAGLKVRVRKGILFGLAYQLPVTRSKDFSAQLVLQSDIEWKTR